MIYDNRKLQNENETIKESAKELEDELDLIIDLF